MESTKPDAEMVQALRLDGTPSRSWWPWAAAAGLVVLLAAIAVVRSTGRGPAVHWAEVGRGDMAVTVEAVGNLEPLHEVEVGPELSGIVATVQVDVNDVVEAEQVLATLDGRLLEAQADQADAEVATSRASLRQARILEESARLERERAEAVAKHAAVAEAELDRVRLNHEGQVAGVQLAQAQLQRALAAQRVAYTNVEKAVLRSPTDGVVLERNVDPGQAVVTSLQSPVLFRVAEGLQEMSLVVEIDEADIARVHAGQTATFTVAAWPGHVFEATVHSVHLAPMPGIEVVTYEAELHVVNTERMLRPGMSASASLISKRLEDVILVPTEALRFDPPDRESPPNPHIWIEQSGALHPVSVTLGPSDQTHTMVSSDTPLVGARVAIGLENP